MATPIKRLLAIKEAGNFTWEELAKLCGVPKPTIQDVALGTKEPKIQTLQTIATHLHISIDKLLGQEKPSGRKIAHYAPKTN